MYQTLDLIQEKHRQARYRGFEAAMKNVSPVMEVRPRRVGGATYQVPMEVPADRRLTLDDSLDSCPPLALALWQILP
jgi:small subunit ribosomal protein S7